MTTGRPLTRYSATNGTLVSQPGLAHPLDEVLDHDQMARRLGGSPPSQGKLGVIGYKDVRFSTSFAVAVHHCKRGCKHLP